LARPAHFDSAEELQAQIDQYFADTPIKNQTITGLALFLGFESRQSFYDYEEKFSYIIKRARLHIEHAYECKLSEGQPTGAIFALKNMGWKDKSEHEHSGNMAIAWNEVKTYGADQKTDHSA
jgi:hypothetical protein